MAVIKVDVCAGTHCTMMGAMDIVSSIESLLEFEELGKSCELIINAVPCDGLCELGRFSPVVRINDKVFTSTDAQTVMSEIMDLIRASNCL